MGKSILKTLIYADIFGFPMKAWEVQKWLIGKKGSLSQVEKALKKHQVSGIKYQAGYLFLKNRTGLVKKRLDRQKQSEKYFNQAKWISQIFKIIPWIKLVGVSGSLAMENATKKDDIDLIIISQKNRLWISRILLLFILEMIGKRRKRGATLTETAGKVCINILLEEDCLAQPNKDIYLAHEVLQMRPLWQRDGIYQKYLEQNLWAFKFLPNWLNARGPVSLQPQSTSSLSLRGLTGAPRSLPPLAAFDLLEKLTRWLQLRYMGKPSGQEKITDTALYFHPQDNRDKVLTEYQKRIKKI